MTLVYDRMELFHHGLRLVSNSSTAISPTSDAFCFSLLRQLTQPLTGQSKCFWKGPFRPKQYRNNTKQHHCYTTYIMTLQPCLYVHLILVSATTCEMTLKNHRHGPSSPSYTVTISMSFHTCVVSAVDDRSHWETQGYAELCSR